MRILITGGAGAIGSNLVKKLSAEHDVIVLDNLTSGWRSNIDEKSIRFFEGSIDDDKALKNVFSLSPEVIYHLAANFANQNSVDHPHRDLQVNGVGTLKLLDLSVKHGVQRFIFASSSCVYGNNSKPLNESTSPIHLETPYAITKHLGENYLNYYFEYHRLPMVILRLFNSFGPGEHPGLYRNVVPNFMASAIRNEPLTITGTGEEKRDFTYINDTTEAFALSMSDPSAVGLTMNVGTGKETSIIDLAQAIIKVTGSNSEIKLASRRNWDRVTTRVADISLIQSKLNYQPETDLTSGLKNTFQWFIETNAHEKFDLN